MKSEVIVEEVGISFLFGLFPFLLFLAVPGVWLPALFLLTAMSYSQAGRCRNK